MAAWERDVQAKQFKQGVQKQMKKLCYEIEHGQFKEDKDKSPPPRKQISDSEEFHRYYSKQRALADTRATMNIDMTEAENRYFVTQKNAKKMLVDNVQWGNAALLTTPMSSYAD